MMGSPAQREPEERRGFWVLRVHKEPQAPSEQPVFKGLRDKSARLDLKEIKVLPVSLARLGRKVSPDPLAPRQASPDR